MIATKRKRYSVVVGVSSLLYSRKIAIGRVLSTFLGLALFVIFYAVRSDVQAEAAPTTSDSISPLQQRAQDAATLFQDHPPEVEKLFSPEFLSAVPASKLKDLGHSVFLQGGKCTGVHIIGAVSDFAAHLQFDFPSGRAMQGEISIDSHPPYLITRLIIRPLTVQSLEDILAAFKELPGKVSFSLQKSVNGTLQPLAGFQPDEELALGSAFKLFVLSELVREINAGTRHWDEIVTLQDSARSLPSGTLHKWPVGAPFTLYSLAGMMISVSDNTAADQLILSLGDSKIESILPLLGVKNPARNVPFLTTLDLFRLKGSSLGNEYIKLTDPEARRKFLVEHVRVLSKGKIKLSPHPVLIDSIEWFASVNDMCRCLSWLEKATATPETQAARDILSINSGLPLGDDFRYVGFKGGSEAGVINCTFWLVNKKEETFFLSASWNNPDQAVDETKFLGLVQSLADLVK